MTALLERAQQRLMRTYPPATQAFVRGRGAALFDEDGQPWLDFLCGLAVTSLGHAHPAVTRAISEQAQALVHTSNLFVTEPAVALAERLARVTGWDDARVFFSQCGASANEAAIKLARKHGKAIDPAKVRLVALEGSFHGRTLATLEATGQPAKHAPFAPLAGYVDLVPHDDPDALRRRRHRRALRRAARADPGRGRGPRAQRRDADRRPRGLRRPRRPAALRRGPDRRRPHRALVRLPGRPRHPGRDHPRQGPGNGLPLGACVARGRAAEVFEPGDHATTFGGNPVTCAAANAVIDTIEADGLLASAAARSRRLVEGLERLVADTGLAVGVRGRGLLLGLELAAPRRRRGEAACRDRA
jgi:acetylornithine/N-succinyldiaminopimelate aminotransferase